MKNIEMDLSAANSNDYIHADGSLQFKRDRRKVSNHLLSVILALIIIVVQQFFLH